MKSALIVVAVVLLTGPLSAESTPVGQIAIKIIAGQAPANRSEAPEGVNVIGAVNQPGFVKTAAPISLKDVIAATGGIARLADRSMINIVDYASGNTYQIQFQGKPSGSDKEAVLSRTFVKPGDVVVIPERYD